MGSSRSTPPPSPTSPPQSSAPSSSRRHFRSRNTWYSPWPHSAPESPYTSAVDRERQKKSRDRIPTRKKNPHSSRKSKEKRHELHQIHTVRSFVYYRRLRIFTRHEHASDSDEKPTDISINKISTDKSKHRVRAYGLCGYAHTKNFVVKRTTIF